MRRLISAGDKPPTGEPNAGNRPVRFGGRGDLIGRPYPYLAFLPDGTRVMCVLSPALDQRVAIGHLYRHQPFDFPLRA